MVGDHWLEWCTDNKPDICIEFLIGEGGGASTDGEILGIKSGIVVVDSIH